MNKTKTAEEILNSIIKSKDVGISINSVPIIALWKVKEYMNEAMEQYAQEKLKEREKAESEDRKTLMNAPKENVVDAYLSMAAHRDSYRKTHKENFLLKQKLKERDGRIVALENAIVKVVDLFQMYTPSQKSNRILKEVLEVLNQDNEQG